MAEDQTALSAWKQEPGRINTFRVAEIYGHNRKCGLLVYLNGLLHHVWSTRMCYLSLCYFPIA